MAIDSTKSIVIGSGGAGAGQGAYQAPHTGHSEHIYNTGLGSPVRAAWWTPMDNIPDLVRFRTIEVKVAEDDDLKIILGGSGQPGLLRIQLHIQY